jgi:hypothetical protein
VDAPEGAQLCHAAGIPWRCGQRAALALSDYLGQRTVACIERDRDRYGRIVGKCSWGHDLPTKQPKVIQIGFNRCGTRSLQSACIAPGWRPPVHGVGILGGLASWEPAEGIGYRLGCFRGSWCPKPFVRRAGFESIRWCRSCLADGQRCANGRCFRLRWKAIEPKHSLIIAVQAPAGEAEAREKMALPLRCEARLPPP